MTPRAPGPAALRSVLRRGQVVSLLLVLLCSFSVELPAQGIPLPGQQEADTVEQAVEPEAEPGPILLEHIPRRLEQDLERLHQIANEVRRDRGFQQVRASFYELLAGADAILDNFEAASIPALHSADLNNFRSSLERESTRLDQRRANLEHRFQKLETNRRYVDRVRLEWALTSESVGLDSIPVPALESAIDRIQAAADSAEVGLDARLLELLEAGDELARIRGRIDTALGQIQDAEATNRRQLLIRDAVPLWRPVAVLAADRPLFGDVRANVAADARVFRESLVADRDRVLLHGLLFFLVLLVFLWLRGLSRDWPDDPQLETTKYMLSRPFSAAGLTALLATTWIYPYASFLITDIVLVLSMIPVLRLLPPLMREERRVTVYGLLALFLASRIALVLPPESRMHRLAILALGVGFVIWALVMVQLSEAEDLGWIKGRWRRLFRIATRVGLGLAVLSIVLNVAGWVGLSEVLIQGIIPSAYLALVVSLASVLLTGVVRGIASSPVLHRSHAYRDNQQSLLTLVTFVIRSGAVVIWAWGTLAWFGSDQELFSRVRALLTHEWSIGAVDISIGRILLFFLILWLATRIGRIVKAVLRDDLLAGMAVSPGQADAWATLAQWAILVIGFLFAAASAGIGGGQLAVLAGALGVGIGFGLQNIVNNFVSGFILIFEQPIKVGDKIEISSLSLLGEVRRIGIRSSTIRTIDGADVVVPNSNLIQSEVVNWTLSDSKRRFQVEVGVRYGTDPQRVLDLLLEVAADHPGVLQYPEPVALFLGFGASSLDFRLNVWCATFDDFFRIRSEVAVRVNDALKAEGIEIPFPQRDLHLRSVAPDAARELSGAPGVDPERRVDPGPTPDRREAPGSPD